MTEEFISPEISDTESKLYQQEDAYRPIDSGYRFTIVARDDELCSPSITFFLENIDRLPVLRIPKQPLAQSSGKLEVISPLHFRTTAIEQAGGHTIKSDAPEYPALSLKGNSLVPDMQLATFDFDPATGIRIQGFLIGDVKSADVYIQRCKRIAQAGLPSERIIAVLQATHVPYEEFAKPETFNQPRKWNLALRQKLIREKSGNPDVQIRIDRRQTRTWGGDTSSNSRRTSNLILNGEILMLLRAMQVNERIRDLRLVKSNQDLATICAPAISFLSIQDTQKYQYLPLEESISVQEFLNNWLPKQMGFHLGSWHAKGLVHGYAHGQNWTLAGTLVDVDSAREKSELTTKQQSEEKVFQGYVKYDVIRSFQAAIESLDGLIDSGVIDKSNIIKKYHPALESFLIEYAKTSFTHLSTLNRRVQALLKLLEQKELPNPHFDSFRDGPEDEFVDARVVMSRRDFSLLSTVTSSIRNRYLH